MKRIKFLALVVAVVCICAIFPSCAEVVTVKDVTFAAITVNVDGDKDLLVETIKGDITGTADDMPTIFDAVIQILEQNGIRHKAEDNAITSIAGKAETTRGGYFYVWEYKINQEEPDGRASEIEVKDGDHICYYLTPAVDKEAAETAVDTEEGAEEVVAENE